MLKGIPSVIDAELLWVLRAMGHGDTLVIADRNFPAHSVAAETVSGRLVQMSLNDTQAAAAILKLFPLDTFVDYQLSHMQVVGEPDTRLEVHEEVFAECKQVMPEVKMSSIERFAFYEAARESFAVVQTIEDRPYGCFILTKGVVFS